MATITTRSGKGSPLTHSEGDANFTNLNNDKLENISEDSSPQLSANLDVNGNQIVSTSNQNVKIYPHGTGVLEVGGDGSSADGTIQLNCSQNSHGVKIKSPAHSAGASYTLTLPTTDGNADEFLKTDGTGTLSWGTPSGGGGGSSGISRAILQSGSNPAMISQTTASWTQQAWAWEELSDSDGIVTTSGNTFTLSSGTYHLHINLGMLAGYAPSSGNVYWPVVALRNSSDSSYPWGWGKYGTYISATQSQHYMVGPTVTFQAYFTIGSSKTFDLVYKQNTSSGGFYVYFQGEDSDWDNNTAARSPGWIDIKKLS